MKRGTTPRTADNRHPV